MPPRCRSAWPGANYTATHGKGWTRFDNDAHDIELELTQCVPTDDPVKLSRLRLCNRSSRTRRLSVTGYVDWALGANGSTPAPFVITSRDPTHRRAVRAQSVATPILATAWRSSTWPVRRIR